MLELNGVVAVDLNERCSDMRLVNSKAVCLWHGWVGVVGGCVQEESTFGRGEHVWEEENIFSVGSFMEVPLFSLYNQFSLDLWRAR